MLTITEIMPFMKYVYSDFYKLHSNRQIRGRRRAPGLTVTKDILVKQKLARIIENYAQVVEKEEPDTKKKTYTQVFPRYHPLDVLERLLADVKAKDIGQRYLIQHSAGSGKSNSITWLAHQLIGLENKQGELMVDSVIVVINRVVLDKQIRDNIKQFLSTEKDRRGRSAL